MVQVLTMPMMGNTMEAGVVAEWLLEEGEEVTEGDPVAVVESEKASTEVTAEQDGVLAAIDVPEGEEVSPGTRLGVIGDPGQDASDVVTGVDEKDVDEGGDEDTAGERPLPVSTDGDERSRVPAAPGARRRAREESIPLDSIEGTGPGGAVLIADLEAHLESRSTPGVGSDNAGGRERVVAAPHVRRLARELDVDLEEARTASGGNRVTEADVRRVATRAASPAPAASESSDRAPGPADPAARGLSVSEVRELSGMRATIADRMARSARRKPHVTLKRTVTADRALDVVDEFRGADAEVGLTDLLVRAAGEALEAHPEFNAWYADGRLSLVEEVNVGVAVDVEDGLVTPVIRDVDRKTPTRIAEERVRLTTAVREGEFSLDDVRGGTFTVTNLGMYGVDSFDPIVDPPQVAILGVGRVRETDAGRELTLSLSFDHRVVDGADAARFLETIGAGFTAPTPLFE